MILINSELESELYQYGVQIGRIWGRELTEIFKNIKIPAKPVLVTSNLAC